jgi:hypothetical protein
MMDLCAHTRCRSRKTLNAGEAKVSVPHAGHLEGSLHWLMSGKQQNSNLSVPISLVPISFHQNRFNDLFCIMAIGQHSQQSTIRFWPCRTKEIMPASKRFWFLTSPCSKIPALSSNLLTPAALRDRRCNVYRCGETTSCA